MSPGRGPVLPQKKEKGLNLMGGKKKPVSNLPKTREQGGWCYSCRKGGNLPKGKRGSQETWDQWKEKKEGNPPKNTLGQARNVPGNARTREKTHWVTSKKKRGKSMALSGGGGKKERERRNRKEGGQGVLLCLTGGRGRNGGGASEGWRTRHWRGRKDKRVPLLPEEGARRKRFRKKKKKKKKTEPNRREAPA